MKSPSPPKFFLRFFRWYCHPKMLDYIEGDLMEVYRVRLKALGKRKADWKFIVDVYCSSDRASSGRQKDIEI
jgi:hypothetical protein